MNRPPAMRMSGGELVVASDVVPLIRELIEIALHTRRDLWTSRSEDEAERTRQLRALTEAVFADTFDNANAQVVGPADLPQSASVSVTEAATMLDRTPSRVRQMLSAGDLSGQQDAPGRPWRVDLNSVNQAQETGCPSKQPE